MNSHKLLFPIRCRVLVFAAAVIIGLPAARALSAQSAQPSLPSEAEVLATIKKVNNYWIAHNPKPGNSDSTQATYFTGDLAAYDATGQSNYLSFAQSWASEHQYSLDGGNTTNYANYQAAGQVYIHLYQLSNKSSDLSGITESVNGMVNSTVADEWTWIDAINMSMPDFAELGSICNNASYYAKMDGLYFYTSNSLGLYNPNVGLWWENSTYVNTGTYWSRGNGWVFAALAKVLSVLPPNPSDPNYDQNYPLYLQTFLSYGRGAEAAMPAARGLLEFRSRLDDRLPRTREQWHFFLSLWACLGIEQRHPG